ncbi:hypothetical protein RUM44_002214 [Polyplax serrata]|uniref:Uncharacterized protein n=1 Tax=Polyplax serrata TaxID=468196 RepID=A0ABR1AM78_POLSC
MRGSHLHHLSPLLQPAKYKDIQVIHKTTYRDKIHWTGEEEHDRLWRDGPCAMWMTQPLKAPPKLSPS